MNAVIVLILLALAGSIAAYLIKQKKRGSVCPGCCAKCANSCHK